MTQDDFDKSLKRVLENVPVKKPDESMADRIVSFAAEHRQESSEPFIREFLSCLISPWPADMMQKAAVLGMIAFLMFGAGVMQGLDTGSDEEAAILSLVYGDFETMEAL